MILGIVGAEAAKFTFAGQCAARAAIADAIQEHSATSISSGHCHLGGIDIWAEEAARYIGGQFWEKTETTIFPPHSYSWSSGYKPRNIKIAKACDFLLNIVVDVLPTEYEGMRFKCCYHCLNRDIAHEPHVKSGGCWTMWYAKEQFIKPVKLLIIRNY